MNSPSHTATERRALSLQVADIHLNLRTVQIEDDRLTGRQLAHAAGFTANQQPTVLAWRPNFHESRATHP